jgi:predicted N-formylglutamate amidohydrolase
MPEVSEITPIPGNVGLSNEARAARINEIFKPYHDAIQAELDRRQENAQPVALIAMHSFTPVFKGVARPWHIGLLYNREVRLSRSLLALLRQESGLVVGDQEPYLVSDLSDYTVPVHGERRKLHLTAIEIRQNLIGDDAGQQKWAALLARLLPLAYRAV